MATFPVKRLRRLRYNPLIRDMVRETELSKNDFIYPLFVVPGDNIKKEIKSTILLITHDIDEAIILSNRIYILSNKPAVVNKEVFVDKSIYNKDNLENIAKLKKEILSYL